MAPKKKTTDDKTCNTSSCGTCCSKQTIVTAVAIVVALAAVVYALCLKNDQKPVTALVPSVEVTELTYESSGNNPVVLKIGGREVTRAAVMDNFAASGSQLPEDANIEDVFPLIQDQYVVSQLLKQAAINNGFSKNTPQVALRVNEALEQGLRAAYIQSVGERNVSDADTKQAYDDIVKNAPDVVERRASHILVADEETAKSLIAQLDDGADFAELAKDNSTGPTGVKGGDLGYFAKTEMVPEFANAAFSMDIGDVSSEPVQTQFGFHVIKLTDERKREKPEYDAIKEQLKNQLRQAVLAEEIQKLRAEADITVFTFDGDDVPQETPNAASEPAADGE